MTKRLSINSLIRKLGPGFVSGAADNDPAGIATYTQAGAQFGYGQLWTALFALPLLIAVQEACARIAVVTGKGLAAVLKKTIASEFSTPPSRSSSSPTLRPYCPDLLSYSCS